MRRRRQDSNTSDRHRHRNNLADIDDGACRITRGSEYRNAEERRWEESRPHNWYEPNRYSYRR